MPAHTGATSGATEKKALVRGSDGRVSVGKLRVAGTELITISFPMKDDTEAPRLVGDTATVTLPDTGTKIEAEISSASLMGFVEVCQFRAIRHLDGPPLQVKGERRSFTRHRPTQHVSIMVTPIESGGGRAVERGGFGHLGDISVAGCSVQLGKSDYRTLGVMTVAALRFKLPGRGEDLEIVAERRNTRTAGTETIWIGFGWSSQTVNAAARKVLNDYLAALEG